jgi:phosphate transport system substrate-binding protein
MGRFKISISAVGMTLAVALAASACSNSTSSTTSSSGGSDFQGVSLTGAGATFPDPIYEQWFKDFQGVEPGAKINYQAIGSGGGIEQFTKQTVQFGASDAPLQQDEIAALPTDYIEFPTVLGGVVVAYNLQGLSGSIKLDGDTTAKIFLGEITNWNDPAIGALNPDLALPDTPISVVHRSDESGTTFVYTSWLAAESSSWESQVGASKDVSWPTGTGGDGNDGVAAGVSQTDGAIGYLSYDFAVTASLGIADIKADDGSYVTPSVESITKAGGGLTFPIKPDTNIINSTTAGAYPISTATYLLLYKDMGDADQAQTLFDFVTWALSTGQGEAEQLNYAPLPASIATQSLDALSAMTANGQPLTASPGIGT